MTLVRKFDATPRVQARVDPNPSRTKQEFAEESNINNIVRNFAETGSLVHVNHATPTYADYTEVPNYQEALNITIKAQDSFMQLPAAMRKRFGNDPAELLAFLDDPDNLEESMELGLVDRPAIEVDGEEVIPQRNDRDKPPIILPKKGDNTPEPPEPESDPN